MASYRIGIDIGGTFTDFTVVDDERGTVVIDKTLTTPRAPEEGVIAGLDRLERQLPGLLASATEVIHATTLVTNVILERKGARTGLITTEGFRDVLEMAREVRYDLFDMFIRLPEPIVPRSLRHAVSERVLADGGVRSGLDVVRMLALGAKGVLLGRAWAFALAGGGGAGVAHVLRLIEAEIKVAMALTGATRIDQIDSSILVQDDARRNVFGNV